MSQRRFVGMFPSAGELNRASKPEPKLKRSPALTSTTAAALANAARVRILQSVNAPKTSRPQPRPMRPPREDRVERARWRGVVRGRQREVKIAEEHRPPRAD